MKRQIQFLFDLLAVMGICLSALAQTQPGAESIPNVDQIMDKYVQALGGKAAIKKLTSRVAKGTFEIPQYNAVGAYESYAKAPNKAVNISTFEGYGVVKRGFDGAVAWVQDPERGLREMSGAGLAEMKRGADFYNDLKLKEHYPKMVLKGKEKTGDRETFVIEAAPVEGRPLKMYFDAQTGLLVRTVSEGEEDGLRVLTTLYYEDYRGVDGVKLPFTFRQDNPNFSFTIKLTEVKHNVAIDDAKFKKPESR